MEKRQLYVAIAVVVGASLLGFLGVFSRYFMDDCGLRSLDVVLIRLSVVVTILLLILAIITRSSLRITKRDIPVMLIFGLFKFLSDYTFFHAQHTISLCMSSLLQMTAPYYVMFVSLIMFRDKITPRKLLAMLVGTMGCILVTGVLTGGVTMEIGGAISALMSGVFYGMFMIGSKINTDRGIKPTVSVFYIFLVADIIAIPFADIGGVVEAVTDVKGMLMALALGIGMTLIPYYIFTKAVNFLEPTVVSMIATLEVVVAAIVGYYFFQEEISPLNVAGMFLVIFSIVLMNFTIRIGYIKRFGKYIPPGLKKVAGDLQGRLH